MIYSFTFFPEVLVGFPFVFVTGWRNVEFISFILTGWLAAFLLHVSEFFIQMLKFGFEPVFWCCFLLLFLLFFFFLFTVVLIFVVDFFDFFFSVTLFYDYKIVLNAVYDTCMGQLT